MQIVAGLIPLVAGALLIVFPAQGLIALTVLVAVIFLLTGLAQTFFALWLCPAPGWVWVLTSAVASVGLGGFILFTLPEACAITFGILVSIDFLSTGISMVLISVSARSGPSSKPTVEKALEGG